MNWRLRAHSGAVASADASSAIRATALDALLTATTSSRRSSLGAECRAGERSWSRCVLPIFSCMRMEVNRRSRHRRAQNWTEEVLSAMRLGRKTSEEKTSGGIHIPPGMMCSECIFRERRAEARPRILRMSSWTSRLAKPDRTKWWMKCAVERVGDTRRFMKEIAVSAELTVRPGARFRTTRWWRLRAPYMYHCWLTSMAGEREFAAARKVKTYETSSSGRRSIGRRPREGEDEFGQRPDCAEI